jgi:DNA-binding transcriptional MerR regulator
LTPERTTDVGYRLYSAQDCLRLELIRTLRGVGFDLGTIGQLLRDKPDVRGAVALQLER